MSAPKGSVPWNAGKGQGWVNKRGYREVYVDTPTGRRARKEHRVVMEQVLGRPLAKDEHVHHINGDKTDNRPENLEVLSATEHSIHHNHDREYATGYRKTCRIKACWEEKEAKDTLIAEMAALLERTGCYECDEFSPDPVTEAEWFRQVHELGDNWPCPREDARALLARVRGDA